METQNVTIALPKDLLLRVKVIAAQRQTSISSLLAQALTRLVTQEDAYEQARRRYLERTSESADLGTNGQLNVSRDALHERR
jgi:predicted transcriptional regulator